jgi:hypothetical protein
LVDRSASGADRRPQALQVGHLDQALSCAGSVSTTKVPSINPKPPEPERLREQPEFDLWVEGIRQALGERRSAADEAGGEPAGCERGWVARLARRLRRAGRPGG